MLRLLAVFLPLFISFLFEACSKQGSALLPGEIIVNASELPGPHRNGRRIWPVKDA